MCYLSRGCLWSQLKKSLDSLIAIYLLAKKYHLHSVDCAMLYLRHVHCFINNNHQITGHACKS